MKKIKIMYDFDGTLCPGFMQEYTLYKALGYKTTSEFWEAANAPVEKNLMENMLALMYLIQHRAKELGIKLTREWLMNHGKTISFYKGVEEYFDKINEYGRKKGVEVEHYIISTGSSEMIEGCKIAHNFKRIYGSFYAYDDNGEAFYPSQVINFMNKTQFLFRLRKDALGYLDDVNKYMKKEDKFAFENMVYIGDGFTDLPCMKIIKNRGGRSISVYAPDNDKMKSLAKEILKTGRVNFCAEADYSEDSKLFGYLKKFINSVAKSEE